VPIDSWWKRRGLPLLSPVGDEACDICSVVEEEEEEFFKRFSPVVPSHDRLLLLQLGFPPDGTTGYYSSNCTKSDAAAVQAFMDAKGISG